jgi:hypothetical protein
LFTKLRTLTILRSEPERPFERHAGGLHWDRYLLARPIAARDAHGGIGLSPREDRAHGDGAMHDTSALRAICDRITKAGAQEQMLKGR